MSITPLIFDLKAAMTERRATIAVAESLTGGHLQALITARSGCSAYFLGGITAYSLAQKAKLLGLSHSLLARENGVSAEIAAQMALGAVRLFGSDYALSTTGYAEPTPDVATPFAWCAIAHHDRILGVERIECRELDRKAVQHHVATEALMHLSRTFSLTPPFSNT